MVDLPMISRMNKRVAQSVGFVLRNGQVTICGLSLALCEIIPESARTGFQP